MILGVPYDFIVQVLVTLLLNGMQFFTAYAITDRLFKKEKISLIRVVVTSFFFYVTTILLMLTFLGAFGLLYYNYLIAFTVILFLISVYFFRKRRHKSASAKIYLPVEAKNVFFWSFISVVLFVVIVKFFVASMQIVTESDSLVYHMPFVARWLQLGHIWEPYFTAYAGPLGYYPSNYELFLTWFVMPFHSDLLVNLVNFLIFPFFYLLFYLVLRQLSVKSDLALLITFVGSSIPVLLRQLGIPQNDLFFMLFFLYSIYFLFSFLRHKNGLYVALLGLALGVFFGTKYTGVPGALPFFILAIGSVIWVSMQQKKVWRSLLNLMPTFILPFVLGGAFWYGRNWVLTGNPFFPIDVHLLGMKVFSGYLGLTEKVFDQSLLMHLGEVDLLSSLVKAFALSAGFISLLLPVFFIIALCFFIRLLYKRYKEKDKVAGKHLVHFAFFVVLLPIYVYIYISAPYTYIHIYPNVRYALPILLLGLLMLGKITSYSKVFFRPVVFFLLVSFFAYFFFVFPFQSRFLGHTNDYVWFDVDLVLNYPDVFTLLIGLVFAFISTLFFLFKRQWLSLIASLIVLVVFLLPYSYYSSLVRESRGYDDEFLRGEQADSVLNAYSWADENIDDDAKIAYTSVGSHYHLFGPKLSREVSYVNINDCRDCLYHDFAQVEGSILVNPSFKTWMENLERHEKEYLIVGWKYFENDPPELTWARKYKKNFKLLFNEGNTYIFKISYDR